MLYVVIGHSLFLIRIAQCLNSQEVTISGSTDVESSHTHTRGTMNIKGTLKSWEVTGAFSFTTSDTTLGFQNGSMWGDIKKGKCTFEASKNWTGSTSAGTAHSHTFSSVTTIGDGEYLRPESIECCMLIKY